MNITRKTTLWLDIHFSHPKSDRDGRTNLVFVRPVDEMEVWCTNRKSGGWKNAQVILVDDG
jgi:hypothetical protein